MSDTKILYDCQIFAKQTHGGISRCFVELYKHLPKGVHAQIAVKESDNVYLKEVQEVQPANDRYNKFISKHNFWGKGHLHIWYDKITHGGYYPDYNENYVIELLKEGDFDVFHPTYFEDYYLPYLKGKPFVLTIHDMIPELYPQFFPKNDIQIMMKRKLAPLANAIIAVSERTKKDIVTILGVPEEKVHVIYHGCSFPILSGEKQLAIINNHPYILYVGGRGYYKNFRLFVKYICSFLKSHSEVFVICTGLPFTTDEVQLLSGYGIQNRFIHYWTATDEILYSLYHQALCFVFPSEYEGFGIPILEAYQANCPVLLNNASCFPEIAGDAAIYFEMNAESSNINEKLENVYNMDIEEKKILLERQRKRLRLYSWSQSARQLVDIYKSIL